MNDEERLAVPSWREVAARPGVPRERRIDGDEGLIRLRYENAIRAGEVESARQIMRDMARARSGAVVDDLERRLWEVLAAYTVTIPAIKERTAIRRTVRESLINLGTAAAVIALQAWAKPKQTAQALISLGLGDMTCEFVMLEFVDQFSAEKQSDVLDGSWPSTRSSPPARK